MSVLDRDVMSLLSSLERALAHDLQALEHFELHPKRLEEFGVASLFVLLMMFGFSSVAPSVLAAETPTTAAAVQAQVEQSPSVASLQAQILALQQQVSELQNQIAAQTTVASP